MRRSKSYKNLNFFTESPDKSLDEIKDQLKKGLSLSVVEDAIVDLVNLMELNKDKTDSIHIAKGKYLVACCLLYKCVHKGAVNGHLSKLIIQLIKEAQNSGLTGIDNALEISRNYNKKIHYLLNVDSVRDKLKQELVSGAKAKKIVEYKERKKAVYNLYGKNGDAISQLIQDDMPSLCTELFENVIDFEPCNNTAAFK